MKRVTVADADLQGSRPHEWRIQERSTGFCWAVCLWPLPNIPQDVVLSDL